MKTGDVAQLLVAVSLLVVAAHGVGHLFARFRQPPVIGEVVGGLLLGPTVLGAVAPGLHHTLFPANGTTQTVLDAFSEFGLLLLMFMAGREVRLSAPRSDHLTVASITATGLLLPFGAGLALLRLLDYTDYSGPHSTRVGFALIFGAAIAVTSIPVISRILFDLGLLRTRFGRIVLSVAVVEDVALYVVLAVALGLADAGEGGVGLSALLGVRSVPWAITYYVLAAVIFFAFFLFAGERIFQRLTASRFNVIESRNPVAWRLIFLLGVVLCSVALGINPVFGALTGGISTARDESTASALKDDRLTAPGAGDRPRSEAGDALASFSLAFFIPVYFATVGLKLDLIREFDPLFFLWFCAFACVVKSLSVWLGARLAGEPSTAATDFAVALNARGGPGIVLATLGLAAQVINARFFTTLVLLSILTSQAAGFWLDRAIARRPGLRPPPSGDSGRRPPADARR